MHGMAGNGRTALVTGAGSGVGRAAALALLEAGYTVALTGRRADALAETVTLAGADGARAVPIPADVTDPAAVDALFAALRAKLGRLDVLFNNAGTNTPAADFGDLTWEAWRSVVSVNLDGAFLVARAAYRQMREQDPKGGRIINNGSISAHTPRPGAGPYNASKHAISGLTKTIALDGRKHGIACGQIDIGNAASAMTARMSSGVMQANGTLAPEPTMPVAEVGRAVVYMASLPPEANVLTMTVMATTMPFVGRG
jgi:NAD(P)-dependent dehydrogenase (short-subunit alcohol dehydrogenase family)